MRVGVTPICGVTAWDDARLVGVTRSLTDFGWCCYLADLAVCPGHQHQGVSLELVARTKQQPGAGCMVQLLAVPSAMAYYVRIGMHPVNNGFILHRDD